MSETLNPWKTLSSREIYENPWIKIIEDQVINPKGGKGIYGRVCMQNVAVAVIPIDHEGYTWIVGQYRYTLNEYSWEIPTGGGSKSVEVIESAKRELREETGLTAKKWSELMRIHTSNSVTDEEGFIFLAEDLEGGETEFDETEDLQIKRLPLSEAIEMVMCGEITDAISIAGLLKAERVLRARLNDKRN